MLLFHFENKTRWSINLYVKRRSYTRMCMKYKYIVNHWVSGRSRKGQRWLVRRHRSAVRGSWLSARRARVESLAQSYSNRASAKVVWRALSQVAASLCACAHTSLATRETYHVVHLVKRCVSYVYINSIDKIYIYKNYKECTCYKQRFQLSSSSDVLILNNCL